VGSGYLVLFQIPAHDLFILTAREEVGLAWTDTHTSHSADVACQRQLQRPSGQIPDLETMVDLGVNLYVVCCRVHQKHYTSSNQVILSIQPAVNVNNIPQIMLDDSDKTLVLKIFYLKVYTNVTYYKHKALQIESNISKCI